jgi:quercetin dioxygenase-like cupin family protein
MRSYCSAAAGIVFLAFVSAAWAQQPPASPQHAPAIKRTVLNKVEVPGANYDVIYALVEIQANAMVGRHTHPGAVFVYVLEGDYSFSLDGRAWKVYKSGESFRIEPLDIHDEKAGAEGAKLLAVFTVERGKPLASPAN